METETVRIPEAEWATGLTEAQRNAAADLLRRYLREPDLTQRYALARELAERAISPRPCRYFAWESVPEEMPFPGS